MPCPDAVVAEAGVAVLVEPWRGDVGVAGRHAVVGVAVVEHVVVVVVVAGDEVGNLAACRFGIVAAVDVERSGLVGGLEILDDGLADILRSGGAVLILHTPESVPAVALADAGAVLEDVIDISLQQVVTVDVPAYLYGHRTEVVAVDPVFEGVVLVVVFVASGQYDIPEGLQVGILGFGGEHAVDVFVTGASELCDMLDAGSDEEALVGVGAEVEVLLVVPDAGGVELVGVAALKEAVLAVVAVEELAVAEVEAELQPVAGVGHGPEAVGAEVHLGNGLGIVALGEGTGRELCVAQDGVLFAAAGLDEERLPLEVGVALLQVGLVVGVNGGDAIDAGRECQLVVEGMTDGHGSAQVGGVGPRGEHMMAVGRKLEGGVMARADGRLGSHVVGEARLQGVLRPCGAK